MKKVKRNVPEALLREQIHGLTLEEVTTSYEFKRLLEASLNALLSNHNRSRRTHVSIKYSPYEKITAFTDDYGCYINSANPMFSEDAGTENNVSVKESCQRVFGSGFHEAGHILYTCFSEMKRIEELFARGELEPDKEDEAYKELKELMKDNKAAVLQGFNAVPIRNFITQLYMRLSNCVEDGRIENLLLTHDNRFMGLNVGLKKLREYHEAIGNTWDMNNEDIPTFMNLCLLYAKYHSVGSYSGGFQAFENAKPIIDEMIETHEAKKFSQLNQRLLLCLWPIIKELITEAQGSSQDTSQNSQGSQGSQDSQKSGSSQSPQNSQESKESQQSSQGSQDSQGAQNQSSQKTQDGTPKDSQGQKSLEEKLQEILDEISKNVPQESSNQKDHGETSEKQIIPETSHGSKSQSLDASISDIMKDIADEKVRNIAADQACEEARKSIGRSRGFAPYTGTKIYAMSEYQYPATIDEATESAIKKAAREIQRHLETDMRTGTSKRKFSGKKFHAEKVVNRDFRYFENKATHKDMPKVKVGLVIDESGSMATGGRSKVARSAAVTLYKIFEYVPNLDIAIYGHSTCGDVEIFNYTDFGIKQKNIEKRLMNISARRGNIDIVPISVMAENLLKQDADTRIMFIITDGLPHSWTKCSTPEQELTEAVNNFARKGIEIIVASIGSDEERLKYIYRKQRFLNISDVSDLPKKVIDVIKRKM